MTIFWAKKLWTETTTSWKHVKVNAAYFSGAKTSINHKEDHKKCRKPFVSQFHSNGKLVREPFWYFWIFIVFLALSTCREQTFQRTNKRVSQKPVEKFWSARKISWGGPLGASENPWYQKTMRNCRITIFHQKVFVEQYRKIMQGNPFVIRNFLIAKNFVYKGVSRFFVKNMHGNESFRNLLLFVSKCLCLA